jgi:hypothetical protein
LVCASPERTACLLVSYMTPSNRACSIGHKRFTLRDSIGERSVP